jgi:hypothetical protein
MATRRIPPEGLTPETAALALSPQQRTALELQALHQQQMQEEPEIDQTPAERIMAMLPNFSESERSSVKLYRVTGPNKYTWLNDYSCEDFEAQGFAGIRNEWGAGEFQVRLYATLPGDSTYCVRAKENITIEASKLSTAPVAQQQNNELSQVLNMLAQGQQKLLEALTNKPPADPMGEMQKMLGLMATMREAMGLNNVQQPQKSNITEIMETIRELRSVAEEINPKPEPAGDPENPMTMLPQLLEIVKMGMSQQAPKQQAFPPVHQPQQLEAPVQSQPEPQGNEDVNFNLINTLKTQLHHLLIKATANADIQETAQYVYDELPDEMIDAFFDDAWWDALKMLAPEVEPHREWFVKVRDAALPLFDADANNQESATAGS